MRSMVSVVILGVGALMLLVVACGVDGEVASTTTGVPAVDGSVVNESPSTTSSGFAGPTDTTPPPFGPSLQLPLVNGYGVLCSGASVVDGVWDVALEGPFAQPELGEFEPIAATYASFLQDAGFEVTRPVDEFGQVRLAGARDDAAVSVTLRNTIGSNLVVAAWVAEPDGFFTVAESAAEDSRCYGVVEGMIASAEAPPGS